VRRLKLFARCTILVTTSTLLVYPQQHLPHVTFATMHDGYQHETEKWARPNTYDEVLQLFEDLESGKLEKTYSTIQLQQLIEYLAILAREGVLPNQPEEAQAIAEDVYELMYGEDGVCRLTYNLQSSHGSMMVPAVLYGQSGYRYVQCGWVSGAWRKAKQFVKQLKPPSS